MRSILLYVPCPHEFELVCLLVSGRMHRCRSMERIMWVQTNMDGHSS